MHDEGIELGVTSQTLMRQIEITGKQMLFLAQKQPKRLLGIFAFDKQLLPEMVGTVKELSENGIGITLLTTQKKRIAKGIADQIGIRDVRSELSKEDKSLLLASLQQEHVEAATVHNLQTLSLIGESRLPILISSRRNPTVPVNLTALGDISAVVQESRQAMARARKRFFWSKI
ncbi:MAG: ATPase, partial [Patescibacteria group bacterium]|nr:ATPase [Patescibacteria group bacterium]